MRLNRLAYDFSLKCKWYHSLNNLELHPRTCTHRPFLYSIKEFCPVVWGKHSNTPTKGPESNIKRIMLSEIV